MGRKKVLLTLYAFRKAEFQIGAKLFSVATMGNTTYSTLSHRSINVFFFLGACTVCTAVIFTKTLFKVHNLPHFVYERRETQGKTLYCHSVVVAAHQCITEVPSIDDISESLRFQKCLKAK